MIVPSRVILIFAFAVLAAEVCDAVEIRGSVIVSLGAATGRKPVSNAKIQASPRSGDPPIRIATTASDGTYIIRDLPAGKYDLKITAAGFYSAELRDVELRGAVVSLPSLPLNIDLIGDCRTDVRPAYYRVGVGPASSAAIGGVVVSDKRTPVAAAVVTLYRKGRGRLSSTTTNDEGVFHFDDVAIGPEEFWVTIEHGGFFLEEVPRLVLSVGLEAVYSPITLEPCSPGRCQPHLKSIRVIAGCA